jgi:hypothetical protein
MITVLLIQKMFFMFFKEKNKESIKIEQESF